MNRLAFVAIFLLLANPGDRFARGDEVTAEDLAFFENRIRPALVEHCYECHSADSDELGGKLRLDSLEGWQQGGESGPPLMAGKPEESLIIQALSYDGLEMPPEKPLPDTVVHDFVKWIERGAPLPPMTHAPQATDEAVTAVELWSLEPFEDPAIPEVADASWPRDPIDHFVLARIEEAGLAPTQDADPRALVRRLYYDLVGLPPTQDQQAEFVEAYKRNGDKALEALVDGLLAQPQFGERWGRYWLDVARYGESNGNDGLGRNPTFPHAWRYRDYVIDAFNADTPYDEFLCEQIAGDLMPSESPAQRDRRLVATGFLAMAAKPAKAMNDNFDMDVVADQIDVVGRGIMGLSVGCARCHDHKFDPIPTSDYYALAGIFTSTETMWGVAGHEKLTAPPTNLHVLTAAAKVLPPADFVETVIVLESATGIPKKIPKSKWGPGTPLAMGVRDRDEPADCKVNINGNAKKLGQAISRGFLSACRMDGEADSVAVDTKQSGRLQLAQWLASERHPLTARVMVNRIWMHLFGEGIVRTPDDFGVYGERPTHPDLLDHLASRFVDSRWSVKQLIRAIVLSRTYQLSSQSTPELLAADADNRLLTRHPRRRLDAESLRDSMLLASGRLDLRPGDGSIIRHRDILVNLAGNLHQPSNHRSVYLCYLRSSPPPELAAFDLPDFTTVTGQREVSTVPGQTLHLLNNPFVIAQADLLARNVITEVKDPRGRVEFAYRRALHRQPSQEEAEGAMDLVQSIESDVESEQKAWAGLCQALLISNEFRYVD